MIASRIGGLPELVLADDAMRPLILEEYSSLLFFRDIVERYGVREPDASRLGADFRSWLN